MNCSINSKRLSGESELQYIWRLCSAKDSGALDVTWETLARILNEELLDDESEYLGESAYRKKYQQAKAFYEDVFSKMYSAEYSDSISQLNRELQRERYKLQTEKLEYNRWLREHARDELFEERVIDAIKLYSSPPSSPRKIEVTQGVRGGLLCLTDCHFGKEYKVFGLMNEVLNEYSPEIFYSRMEKLYSETLEYIRKEGLSSIHIYNLGDSVEGFIRHSQLWSLRWGVIDSAIIFGNYMGDWLHKLSEDVAITYFQTDGNHDELRLLDGKKGQHLCESAGKIIKNCIVTRNAGNENFKYMENKTGLIFDNICGFNILGTHGEVGNLSAAIKEYSTIYNVDISYLICGHKHTAEVFKNCGIRKGCIRVGSLIGIDEFSMSIRQSSDASASFFIFEEGKGKVDEHTFILN